ncbi:MAG: SelB C-terminal domain-containing protein, partial [Trebonia sp.]
VAGDWLADPALWTRLRAELPEAVTAFAAQDPLARGMPVDAARAALGLPDRELVTALLGGDLGGDKAVAVDGGYLRLAASAPGLPPKTARAVAAVRGDLERDPFGAPDAQRLRDLGLDGKAIATAARAGLILRLDGNVVLGPGAAREAARILADLPQPFTTSQARQALRTTRRVAIPLLEHLDRTRVTERLPGDLRRLRGFPDQPLPGATPATQLQAAELGGAAEGVGNRAGGADPVQRQAAAADTEHGGARDAADPDHGR